MIYCSCLLFGNFKHILDTDKLLLCEAAYQVTILSGTLVVTITLKTLRLAVMLTNGYSMLHYSSLSSGSWNNTLYLMCFVFNLCLFLNDEACKTCFSKS